MSSYSSSTRGLLAVAALLAGTALAQPVNDTCAGAIAIAPTIANVPVVSPAADITSAAAVSEELFSCQATTGWSVWYTITPSVSATYRLETCTTTAPLDNIGDTVLAVYTGTCGSPLTQLASGCSDDSCGLRSSLTIALAAGTPYFIQVAKYGTTAPSAGTDTIQMSATLLLPPANDRCDGTVPSLALNTPRPFATNALTGNDSELGGGAACYVGLGHSTTTLNAPGRDVVFNFTPASAGAYNVRLGAPSVSTNAILYMTDSCVTAMTPPQTYSPPQCIAAANRVGSTVVSQEELICVPLVAGTPYFIWADETALSSAGASYELEVTSCVAEVEANDTAAAANTRACPTTGRISPSGDVDFYQLGTNPAGARVFAMVEGIAAGLAGATSTTFDLRVTTATDTLEFDDADTDLLFGGSAGSVAGTPLPAAPAFLRVSNSAATAIEPYRIHSVIQPGPATAEAEPNDTIAQATSGASNYFSGDVTATTDLDLFAFGARAGDLVFLSLDSQPSRSGAAATGNHTLQLLDRVGAPLVAVNDSNTTVNNTVVTGALNSISPALPSEALVYRIRANGTYYARVGRTSAAGTGTYLLSISMNCMTGGGIIGAPTLTSLAPSRQLRAALSSGRVNANPPPPAISFACAPGSCEKCE